MNGMSRHLRCFASARFFFGQSGSNGEKEGRFGLRAKRVRILRVTKLEAMSTCSRTIRKTPVTSFLQDALESPTYELPVAAVEMPPLAVDADKSRVRDRIAQQLAVGDVLMRDLAAFQQL